MSAILCTASEYLCAEEYRKAVVNMTTWQIIIVCAVSLVHLAVWALVQFYREDTKRLSIASQERVYNSVRSSNAEAIRAMGIAHNGKHEPWCGSMDGKECNCK
jgi:low affinity Fe/Cu permease